VTQKTQVPGRVSVIVPTRNSAEFLPHCLDSLYSQTYLDVEVIVVDNYSSDGTREIATSYGCDVYTIGPERSSQVNYGVSQSTGEFIYRVDSDCVVDPIIVEECVSLCRGGAQVVAVWCVSDPTGGFWAAVRHFERRMYLGDPLVVGARFFPRSVFDSLGGFDESLVAGEDYDLHNRALRARMEVAFTNSGEINLGDPRTLSEIVIKAFYYGRQFPAFVAKNPDRGLRQLLPFRGAYVRNARQFVRHPILTLGFLVMQTSKYLAGAVGYVAGVVTKHEPVSKSLRK